MSERAVAILLGVFVVVVSAGLFLAGALSADHLWYAPVVYLVGALAIILGRRSLKNLNAK